jgi:RNA polymerase sigma-70 factor, ECF subfamily
MDGTDKFSSKHGPIEVTAAPRVDLSNISFEYLYEEWIEQVARWVGRLGVRDSDRDDIVQDVFMIVHRRLTEFDGTNIAGWLYRITRRKARDYRRLAWFKHIFSSSRQISENMLSTQRLPLNDLETKSKIDLLERLLATLNEDQRAAFVLFEIEGNSGEEIAELQQASLHTVRTRIHRARLKVRRLARLEANVGRQLDE